MHEISLGQETRMDGPRNIQNVTVEELAEALTLI